MSLHRDHGHRVRPHPPTAKASARLNRAAVQARPNGQPVRISGQVVEKARCCIGIQFSTWKRQSRPGFDGTRPPPMAGQIPSCSKSRTGRVLGLGDDGPVEERVRALIEAGWESSLGIDRALLRSGGVHVVAADLGDNVAMSFLYSDTCPAVAVPDHQSTRTARSTSDLDATAAFTADTLRALVGADARVDGPSVHCYADERSFSGRPDAAVVAVDGR